MNFQTRLRYLEKEKESLLCVGLDPQISRLPDGVDRSPDGVLDFNIEIIKATSPHAVAFKMNSAFYEALGPDGLEVLRLTREMVPSNALTILDGKRGDIGNSASRYAEAAFEVLGFDAVTVNPYLGRDTIIPFLEYEQKGVFVLVRSSNPSSGDLQNLETGGIPLYMHVARLAASVDPGGQVGLIMGATFPDALRSVRSEHQEIPILIPGVGFQGGDLCACVSVVTSSGDVLINSSRTIIYASNSEDFAEIAGREAQDLARRIRHLWVHGISHHDP